MGNLPKSPNKNNGVTSSLVKKYKIRIALSKKKGRKHKELSEEQIS